MGSWYALLGLRDKCLNISDRAILLFLHLTEFNLATELRIEVILPFFKSPVLQTVWLFYLHNF